MKPLVSRVPFVGAITICFLESPYFDFALTDMANVLNLPGLQQTINAVLKNVINQLLVFPNRLPIALIDEVDIQRLKYPTPQGVLRINVVAAQNLRKTDLLTSKSDPYCVINVAGKTLKTEVRKGSLNPFWDVFYDVIVPSRFGCRMNITLFDHDQGSKDDLLGTSSVALDSVYDQGHIDSWIRLQEVTTGEVHLKLTWLSLSRECSDFAQALEQATRNARLGQKQLASGLLYVVVEQAQNLSYVKHMKEPSAVCEMVMGQDVQKTETQPYSRSPTWDSIHQFLVYNPHVDLLNLSVTCGRTNTKLGHCEIPIKHLLKEQMMTVSRPYFLKEGGCESALIHLHLQLFALRPRGDDLGSSSDQPLDSGEKPATVIGSTDETEVVQQPEELQEPREHVDMVVRNRKSEQGRSGQTSSDEVTEVVREMATPTPLSTPKTSRHSQVSSCYSERGRVLLTLEYPQTGNSLQVVLHKAENLPALDKDGYSDPYVKLRVRDRQGRVRGNKAKTEVHKNNLNPTFDQTFHFDVPRRDLSELTLHMEVKNQVSLLQRIKFKHIGTVDVELSTLLTQDSVTEWYSLQEKGKDLCSDGVSA